MQTLMLLEDFSGAKSGSNIGQYRRGIAAYGMERSVLFNYPYCSPEQDIQPGIARPRM